MSTRRAQERDLRHDADPIRFGAAAVKCEGFTPDCSYHQRCMMGGECFASPPHLVAARMIEKQVLDPLPDAPGVHRAYIREVVTMLREGRVRL
ncbi:MAG TPA: hypothetical protein VF592_03560 [Sphingomonas sp.]|jgi:hypothetical protein|uniref:hypothetical protein n=1 Tax=Sphingomonas sp. TaxID=28214 RepID=UPI002ED88DC1